MMQAKHRVVNDISGFSTAQDTSNLPIFHETLYNLKLKQNRINWATILPLRQHSCIYKRVYS